MSRPGLYSPVIRRIITIILLIGITGSFLVIYYSVYLPQQRTQYNLRLFRILHEISSNFKSRIENYGTVYSYNLVNQQNTDDTIPAAAYLINQTDSTQLNTAFLSSFTGDPLSINAFRTGKRIIHDSVRFFVDDVTMLHRPNKKSNHTLDTTQSLGEILEPIIKVHATTFESVLLVKQRADSVKKGADRTAQFDAIVYKSENFYIANINTDSLFHNKNIEAPAITNLDIEGTTYKMFLLPFKLKTSEADTYVLAGIVSDDTYKAQSQSIPVDLLLSLCVILILLLMALPFLKVFFLSAEENITIRDVRTIIVVIFIIPFFITIICSAVWLFMDRAKWTAAVLQSLQHNIEQHFYNEINQSIEQIKAYDYAIMHAAAAIDTVTKKQLTSLPSQSLQVLDLKDIVFYPKIYKNFTSVHWMNDDGNDVAAWMLVNRLTPTYFQLSDRQYFRDIKYKRGYVLPNAPPSIATDSFGIQPALSRLTGEYTINISTHSNAQITTDKNEETIRNKTAIAVSISSKMYTVWNTVLPKDFAFCIIDEGGNIICHSDTARSLQENIFEESSDSLAIHNVINHKDSALLPNISLYEQSVRMMIKPMPGLPYYLITYYNKRGEYLFLLHIIAFAVVCTATLLLFASLFSYSMMMGGKHSSKLLFIPAGLNWIKPSADKKNYYVRIIYQCITFIGLTLLFAAFYRMFYGAEEHYLFVVNAALLLPLFVITGYYTIKRSRDFIIKEKIQGTFFNSNQLLKFLTYIRHILALYIVSVLLFAILQNVLFFSNTCTNENAVLWGIWILIILALLTVIVIAGLNPDYKTTEKKAPINNHYLSLFIGALLLGAISISVIPTVTFISYAYREEKLLQLQSLQINLAKKIQQRRVDTNQLFWKSKLNIAPFKDAAMAYINDLKFSTGKGIYLLNNTTLDTTRRFGSLPPSTTTCSPFYKSITQYLFLPPDHDEFYDDSSHNNYYYWHLENKQSGDVLQLLYNNTNDNRNSSIFTLTSFMPHSVLFANFTDSYVGWITLLILLILIFLLYTIIYSIAKRVFLMGFFTTNNMHAADATASPTDAAWLQKSYRFINLHEVCKGIINSNEEVNFATIREIENAAMDQDNGEETIIQLHLALKDVYEDIWKRCTDVEKYILYDYATDGFTNYKQVMVLYELFRKGLLVKEADGNITLVTKSFRNFLITKQETEEVKRMSSQSRSGSWSTLRTFFYVILIAIAIFIFISQEEASKRLITIITSMGALLPAILKLFDKSTFSTASAGKSNDNKGAA